MSLSAPVLEPLALPQVADAGALSSLEIETQAAYEEARGLVDLNRFDRQLNRWWSLGLLLASVCYTERLTDLSPILLLLLLAVGLGWWDQRYQTPKRKSNVR